MSSSRSFAAALEAFLLMLAVSLVHRLLAFGALANGPPALWSVEGLQALVVGVGSDLWVCYLVALVVLLLYGGGAVLGLTAAGRASAAALLLGLGAGAAIHQTYVDFFHFQIIPFHLRYLADLEFLSANGAVLFNLRAVAVFAAFVGAAFWLLRADLFGGWSVRKQAVGFAGLTVLCLGAHNRNIAYRVQWFVPDNLQVNAIERLYLHLMMDRLPNALEPEEVKGLATMLGDDPGTFGGPLAANQFFRLLTRPAAEPSRPVAIAIKGAFAQAVQEKRKPLVMILLLESLRPSETGYFAPAAGTSLTPALDALGAHGIVFHNAYSTGSVTRGAQEASFCGYLGSRNTSLMRGEAIARLICLPDLVAGTGEAFWYHGGDGRYDGQVAYWRMHGIHEFMTESDFHPETPRSGWGVGDKPYLKRTADRLADLRSRSTRRFLFGMGLTVTNHIPWDLPSDAGPEIMEPRTGGHPSYKTTAYTDVAVGVFVQALRDNGLWPDTVLIVASDHGNNVQPLTELYQDQALRPRLLQSHINLILAGGLVETALKSQGVASMALDDLVSQADIASFAGFVMDLPSARFMGQNLLKEGRSLPVLSDLEEDLFDHASGRVFSRAEVTKADVAQLPVSERKSLLYYRAFLQYIYAAPDKS